mmetsp:Transcript_32897/g.111685  ORF Transcript_32897/g.111685 Transcript_32897/m.111685 type:complete len:314 (-) Transcript_32897:528-1469(-)
MGQRGRVRRARGQRGVGRARGRLVLRNTARGCSSSRARSEEVRGLLVPDAALLVARDALLPLLLLEGLLLLARAARAAPLLLVEVRLVLVLHAVVEDLEHLEVPDVELADRVEVVAGVAEAVVVAQRLPLDARVDVEEELALGRRAELEEPVAEDLELAPHEVVLAGDEGAERALEEEARRVRLEQVVLEALRRDLLEDVRGLVVALELQRLDARGLERALAAPAVLRLVVQTLRGRAVHVRGAAEREHALVLAHGVVGVLREVRDAVAQLRRRAPLAQVAAAVAGVRVVLAGLRRVVLLEQLAAADVEVDGL